METFLGSIVSAHETWDQHFTCCVYVFVQCPWSCVMIGHDVLLMCLSGVFFYLVIVFSCGEYVFHFSLLLNSCTLIGKQDSGRQQWFLR